MDGGQLMSFTSAMDGIQQKLYEMGKLLIKEHQLAICSIFSEEDLGEELLNLDIKVDEYDQKIHSSILQLITIQPPLPKELEALATMIRISRELERVGDHSVNIAEVSKSIKIRKRSNLFNQIKGMSELTLLMLEESVQVLNNKDIVLSQSVVKKDNEVDRYFIEIQKYIVQEMKNDQEQIDSLANLLLVNRYLERGADHVVNVARLIKGIVD